MNEVILTPAPRPEPLVRLRGVSVSFGKQPVLENIHLDLYPHETLAIIGESGCGKSVTLKLIVGLLKPDEGEVFFEGQSLRTMKERDLIRMRLRVGFLFQSAALFDSLNVYDNIAFGIRAKGGFTEADIRVRVLERLMDVGLSVEVENKMPSELSGGMRKRVGLARALALDPDLMLYDEPTTGLDPIMTDVINSLISLTRKRRMMTSIVVTHEMRTVAKTADRVVMLFPKPRLRNGEAQVIYDGSPHLLSTCPDARVRQFVEGEARDRLTEIYGDMARGDHSHG
jgi:phospholipid/cholesterol/gamma-HCH transport system ATP-binding protein